MASISFSFLDHSEENSSVVFQVGAVTGATYDAHFNYGTAGSARQELQDALVTATRGTLQSVRGTVAADTLSGTPPADPDAQREDGLRIWARGDTTTRLYSWTVPTADRSVLAQPGSDDVPLADAELSPLVAAIEAHVQPEYAPGLTESVTVVRARLIGRNN